MGDLNKTAPDSRHTSMIKNRFQRKERHQGIFLIRKEVRLLKRHTAMRLDNHIGIQVRQYLLSESFNFIQKQSLHSKTTGIVNIKET
jgi:hypothetical protein